MAEKTETPSASELLGDAEQTQDNDYDTWFKAEVETALKAKQSGKANYFSFDAVARLFNFNRS